VNSIVSIITPSFNRADIIDETAQSIFGQTYPNWEWVIVDDGSTDNSWQIINDYAQKDKRVKVFKRERQPKGACACRNIAVEKSIGKYVMFLDTDDLLAPYCLEQRVQVMDKNANIDFAIFPMNLFKQHINDMNKPWSIDKKEDDLHRLLIVDPVCQGTGTLWKKESFIAVGMWREDLMIWQDIELHIRSLLWPAKYIKRMDLLPDVYLRITDNSLSRGGYYSEPKVRSRLDVFSYAVKTIAEKKLLSQYRDSLRYMGFDLFISMLYSRRLKMASTLLDLLNTYDLVSEKEQSLLKIHYRIHQLRLYKLRKLDHYYYTRVSEFATKAKEKATQLQLLEA
jgi:glycosyltransferase involved in cell wall biosynthesis